MALKEQEFEQRLLNDRDERQFATETEKLKALKLEASKWKQAMKEAEKRMALEINQAREQGRDEREAELMIELSETKKRCDVLAGIAITMYCFPFKTPNQSFMKTCCEPIVNTLLNFHIHPIDLS